MYLYSYSFLHLFSFKTPILNEKRCKNAHFNQIKYYLFYKLTALDL